MSNASGCTPARSTIRPRCRSTGGRAFVRSAGRSWLATTRASTAPHRAMSQPTFRSSRKLTCRHLLACRHLGGCRPGLLAHLSRFSITRSWLGRLAGGEGSLGERGRLLSCFIGSLLIPDSYLVSRECEMNKLLFLLNYFTHLMHDAGLTEPK